MGLVFIPIYIRYLGVEAYGLIGVFATLQAGLVLLDMGMSPALSREMARYTGGAHNEQSIWDLLRSIEIVAIVIACLVVFVLWGASKKLATNWLHPQQLSVDTISHALTIMGCVCGLRFVENIYKSCIIGLQRQVLLNLLNSVVATVRGGGVVLVLVFYSSTIQAFFVWQGIVSLISIIIFMIFLYRYLPDPARNPRFSWEALSNVWRFAGGMMIILLLATLLTQTDKIILSRLLSLEMFGYYTLASTVASVLYMLAGPVSQAFYPKFTELVTRSDIFALSKTFHKGAQIISVLMGSAAMFLIFFADVLLKVWTGDDSLVLNVSPILSVLSLGTLLNGLMWLPGQMQLAHGFTRTVTYINCVAVAMLFPLLLWIVPRYGAIGAAWGWVSLNAGYFFVGSHFLYKRVLPLEKLRWYWQDVALPILASGVIALTAKHMMPIPAGLIGQCLILIVAGFLIILASIYFASYVKCEFKNSIKKAIAFTFSQAS